MSRHHKDMFGFPLEVGDLVVTNNKRYSCLEVGSVVSFTPKKIKVRFIKHEFEYICTSNQLLKINFLKEQFPEKFL